MHESRTNEIKHIQTENLLRDNCKVYTEDDINDVNCSVGSFIYERPIIKLKCSVMGTLAPSLDSQEMLVEADYWSKVNVVLTLSQMKDLKSLQTTILNLMKMAGKRVDNAVGKQEIACYEQFLFFPQSLQKNYQAEMQK